MAWFWYGMFGVFTCASVFVSWRVGPELLRAPRELLRGPWLAGLDGGLWFAAALVGGAGAIQVADAVAVGGPGVLPWLWACALLAAPLFYAEAILARVAPAGAADGNAPGSLAAHFHRAAPSRAGRLAFTLFRTVAALGAPCLIVAAMLHTASGARLLSVPESTVWTSVSLATMLTVVWDRIPFGAVGAICAAVIAAPFAGSVLGHTSDVPGVMHRSFAEAFSTGVTGTVPFVALSHILPLFLVWVGISAVVRGRGQGSVAREAALSGLAPILAALLLTAVGLGVAVSPRANQPIQSREGLINITARRTMDGVEDATTTPYSGYERFINGRMRSPGLRLVTERGPIVDPVIHRVGASGGKPGQLADVAIQFRSGEPFRMLESRAGALVEVSPDAMRDLWVDGAVLPRRSELLLAEAGEGPARTWPMLIALMLGGLVAIARWAAAARGQIHGLASVLGPLLALAVGFVVSPAALEGPVLLSFIFLTIAPLLAIARYARPRL